MDAEDVAALAGAVDSMNDEGDGEPFVGLMADDMVWTGMTRGLPWRRRTPT